MLRPAVSRLARIVATEAPDEHAHTPPGEPGVPRGQRPGEPPGASREGAESPATRPAQPASTSYLIRRESERIGLALRGELKCVVCKYDLQSLSVRGVCPECGTAVRATILMMVDPRAEALAPMPAPRLTAIGLALWSGAGLLAALLCWLPRLADFTTRLGVSVPRSIAFPHWLPTAIVALAALSGVGAIAFIRPIPKAPRGETLAAVAGLIGHAVAVVGLWKIYAVIDRASPWAYLVGPPNPERLLYRCVVALGLIVALAGVRPSARRLVQRSLALRTGRVDRQTILAMVGVLAFGCVGDGIRLLSTGLGPGTRDMIDDMGTVIIALASLLLTVGLGSALIDSIRIGRAIITPMPTLKRVIEGN